MQVKKFKASSVTEALQKIKLDLGPEAIILSTQKEKSFLKGDEGYEVVAAISSHQLAKKKWAEKKMGEFLKPKWTHSTASQQRNVIDYFAKEKGSGDFEKNVELKKTHNSNQKLKSPLRYIDIIDEKKIKEPLQEPSIDMGGEEKSPNYAEALLKSEHGEAKPLSPDPKIQSVDSMNPSSPQKPQTMDSDSEALICLGEKLTKSGVEPEIVKELLKEAVTHLGPRSAEKTFLESWLARWILDQIQVSPIEKGPWMEIFIGPHGSGKTTAFLKMATYYVVQKRKSVALLSCDLCKVGAGEHLQVFSRILNVPLYVCKNQKELEEKIRELNFFDSILVDTPGVALDNMKDLDFMMGLSQMKVQRNLKTHLVLSALSKSKDLYSHFKRFQVSPFHDVIISNIDQTSQHGLLLNMQFKFKPIFHSFGMGCDIVEDFEYASRERVLDLIFKLTKVNGEKFYGTHENI